MGDGLRRFGHKVQGSAARQHIGVLPGAGDVVTLHHFLWSFHETAPEDDNIKVAQHFFALRLATVADTRLVLQALQRASVATDPSNPQLVKLTSGPSDLAGLAKQLGQIVRDNTSPVLGTLSVKTASSQIRLIGKPSGLHVPPWHMVSSLLGGQSLRTATWWQHPEINSTRAGFVPKCWDSNFKSAPGEVQSAVTGQWSGKKFKLSGNPTSNANHAKLGVSISGSKLAVMGDMNQQGSLGLPGEAGGLSDALPGRSRNILGRSRTELSDSLE